MSEIKQWVKRVVAYSTQYNGWPASNVCGKPTQYPKYGDFNTCWAPSQQNNTYEYLELEFDKAVVPTFVEVYETYNPGSLVKISAKDPKGNWVVLWTGARQNASQQSRIFSPLPIKKVNFKTNLLRLDINQFGAVSWYEIDAVQLTGITVALAENHLVFTDYSVDCMIQNKNFSDIELVIGQEKKSFFLHKAILSQSSFFKELIEKSNESKLILDDMSVKAFNVLLNLLYKSYEIEVLISDEKELDKLFKGLETDDIIELAIILRKYKIGEEVQSVLNLKLKKLITQTTVLDVLGAVENYLRKSTKQRFFTEDPIKKLCFNYFSQIQNEFTTYEEFYEKFVKLDKDLKIELLTCPDADEDGEEEEDPEKKEKNEAPLRKQMEGLFKDNSYSDVELVSNDGKSIKAHRFILASESRWFAEKLDKKIDQLNCDVAFSILEFYVSWAYLRSVKIPDEKEKGQVIEFAKLTKTKILFDALEGKIKKKQKSCTPFGWQLWNGSSGTTISQDKLTVTRTGGEGLDRTFGDRVLDRPKHYFEIEIVKMSSPHETFIGITDNLQNTTSRNNITIQLAGNYKNNCSGNIVFFLQGERVGVLCDYVKKKCFFFKDGKPIGISGNLKPNANYYAVVHFKFNYDAYKLKFPPIPEGF